MFIRDKTKFRLCKDVGSNRPASWIDAIKAEIEKNKPRKESKKIVKKYVNKLLFYYLDSESDG